jgi:putative Holliday junction resolvase
MIPPTGPILGVDWGEVRIGLAATDPLQIIASPLGTLVRRRGKRFPMPAFLAQAKAVAPVGVVVGHPLESSGEAGAAAAEAEALARAVARRTGLPVVLWDERLSTARAQRLIREQGGSTRGRREDVDALAAAVLLQHFLDARRRDR